MTDLFTLLGKVVVDTQEANESLDDTVEKAEKSEGKLSSIGEKIGNGLQKLAKAGAVVLAATATAAATALVSLSTKAVQCYADYEQLVGGVETLFGTQGAKSVEEYAKLVGKSTDEVRGEFATLSDVQDTVLQDAKTAYKDAGLSANEYMETVTGFAAALKSGLGEEHIGQLANYANTAVTDMADNANKMGTSMESIQNAYQGFAKQNYTMLDNLKLGYGGTKEEMERLLRDAEEMEGYMEGSLDISNFADIVEAIHIVQENMGIAGTTTKEAATTIQGSVGMMKAAWENFLTGMADPEQDFDVLLGNLVDSVVTVADNLIPRIAVLLPRLVAGLSRVAQSLAGYIPDIVQQLLPALLDGVGVVMVELTKAIPAVLQTLVPVVVNALGSIFEQINTSTGLDFSGLFNGIVEGASQMGEMLKSILPSIISVIQQLIPPLLQIAQEIIPILVDLVTELTPILMQIIDAVVPIVAQLLSELAPPLLQIIQAILPAVTALLEPIIMIIQSLCTALSPIISILGSVISQVATMLIPVIQQLCDFITTVLTPIIQGILTVVEEVIGWVVTFVQENMTTIQAIFQSQFDAISGIIQFFAALFTGDWSGMWEAIKSILNAALSFIQNIFLLIQNFISAVGSAIRSIVANAFENIKASIVTKLTAAQKSIINIFNAVRTFISGIGSTIWSFITNAFENVRISIVNKLNAAKASVVSIFTAVKNEINNKMEAVKQVVSNAVQKLKDLFNFEWKLPELKLPHFSVEGGFSLNPPSAPKFGIEWYAKGGVMNEPTAFGLNPNTGKVMVGGEKGAEAIAPVETLKEYISEAVTEAVLAQNAGMIEVLQNILYAIISGNDRMKQDFMEALEAMRFDINNREFARLVKEV